MARYQLAGAVGSFNFFAKTLCARAMRHMALVGEKKQRDLMAYYRTVIGGRGQFTFAFERFCCHDVERAHVHAQSQIREIGTDDGSVFHVYTDGGFASAHASRAHALEWIERRSGALGWRACSAGIGVDGGSPLAAEHESRHFIARLRTPTGRDSVDRHNRVRYIGTAPAVIVSKLSDRALTAAYESLEQQVTPSKALGTVEIHDEERADLDAWIDLVRGEIAARGNRIGRTEWEPNQAQGGV